MTQRSDFARLRRVPPVYSGPLWLRAAVHSPDAPYPDQVQLAFAIGKRFGNAVERNRARRRLRAAFDTTVTHNASPPAPGVYLLGLGRVEPAQLENMTFTTLESHVSQLFERVEVAPK